MIIAIKIHKRNRIEKVSSIVFIHSNKEFST